VVCGEYAFGNIFRGFYLGHLDIYATEKPFEVAFDLSKSSSDARQSNLVISPKPIRTIDARGISSKFLIGTHRFKKRNFIATLHEAAYKST
jgi:hypothetical protein